MTDDRIDYLIAQRNKLTSRRDGLIDSKRIAAIDAKLAMVPSGTRNDVDLLLGRSGAQLPGRLIYGAQSAPDDYRIANRPNNPNWHGVAAWFDEAAHVDPGALFSASLSPELAADIAAITAAIKAEIADRMAAQECGWKDQTDDFDAEMAQYGADIDDTPKDWRDIKSHH